jgi:hypothetical protein
MRMMNNNPWPNTMVGPGLMDHYTGLPHMPSPLLSQPKGPLADNKMLDVMQVHDSANTCTLFLPSPHRGI